MNDSGLILETRALVKSYPNLLAVDRLDLKIREGVCFGLLGPNGAGKTTTIEMIENIIQPTSGQILFRGEQIGRRHQKSIGIQFQSTSLPDKLRVIEVLKLFRSFYDKAVPVDQLIAWCDLEDIVDRESNKLSGGQRQRLLLALSLINDPDLVFLDEPTTGLDPEARRMFWDLIRSIKRLKKTIVLTTHYMEEAYELCDEIGIMNRGRIIALGAPDRLLSENFQGLAIKIPKEDLGCDWEGIPGKVFVHEDTVEIQTMQVNDTLRTLLDRNVSLARVQIRSRNLDDLFLQLTARARKEGVPQ